MLAFQRIEVVFFVPEDDAREILQQLLIGVKSLLMALGLRTRSRIQSDEMEVTAEVLVEDLEAEDNDGCWVEVVGSHLHGRLLLDGLGGGASEGYVTGCCGIGLSRIANLLTGIT